MRVQSCLVAVFFTALMIVLAAPPAYPITCYIADMKVDYPIVVGRNQVFPITTSFTVYCSGHETRRVRVQVVDGVEGTVLSETSYDRTSFRVSGIVNIVTALDFHGYWHLMVRASVANAPTFGTTGWGFEIFIT